MKLPAFQTLWLSPAVIWVLMCPALLIFSVLSNAFQPGLWWEVYFLAVSVLSPITFLTYGWDKRQAQREQSRVSEKTLHFLAICGGWPGAVLGQHWFRHKSIKRVFRLILTSTMVIHISIVATLCYSAMR